MKIEYRDNLHLIDVDKLKGFFAGWPNPPDCNTHFKILNNSYAIWLALHEGRVVGFINAISDKIFYSYIPLLEVLPDYQSMGIGRELVRRMINSLSDMYAIDIICDESIASFYESSGFNRTVGIIKRNYKNQNGNKLNN